ncbi:hypothetical protein [Rhizobium tumorigenes]|nr:hypothetical protein [Rhizobium tumorigenes]WFS00363.1 hypothetical protein PR016_14670 [Rhizobium tumorigenes]
MQSFLQLVARKMRFLAPIHLSIGDIDTRFFSKYNACPPQKVDFARLAK